MFVPSGDFPGAVFRHLSVASEEYCKPIFAISWGKKAGSNKMVYILLMPQCQVLEIIFPGVAEALGSARPRAHPKTLLLLAEASSSAAS